MVIKEFDKALREMVVEQKEPQLLSENLMLSATPPFPTSKKALEAKKTIFNYTPWDNDFEYAFAKLLDKAEDIKSFTKIPEQFGFCIQYTDTLANIRQYYPDFIVVTDDNVKWIIETKGREDIELQLKDTVAMNWCKTASKLTKENWNYIKVPLACHIKSTGIIFYINLPSKKKLSFICHCPTFHAKIARESFFACPDEEFYFFLHPSEFYVLLVYYRIQANSDCKRTIRVKSWRYFS